MFWEDKYNLTGHPLAFLMNNEDTVLNHVYKVFIEVYSRLLKNGKWCNLAKKKEKTTPKTGFETVQF